MGSGSAPRNTSSTNVPWGPQGTQFQRLYDFASPLLNRELQYFPESTVADRPFQLPLANQMSTEAALDPQLTQAALGQATATQRGDFLRPESNPFLRGVFDTAAQDVSRSYLRTVLPNIESRFAGAGRGALVTDPGRSPRVGSFDAARAASFGELGDSLSQMAANLYGGNFQAERGRQTAGLSTLPAVQGQQYRDIQELRQAGRDEFAYAQLQLDDMINRFNFAQQEPFVRGQQFQGLISEPGGYGTSFGRGPGGGSPGALQYAGLASTGLGLLGSILGSVVPGIGNVVGGALGSGLGAAAGAGVHGFGLGF